MAPNASSPNLDLLDIKSNLTAESMKPMEELPVLETAETDLLTVAVRRVTIRERVRAIWTALRAAVGAFLGLLPHLLHHVGIFAGAALLAGFWGNAALYLVGLLLSIPMLKWLRRRFSSPIAPVIGVLAFTGLFLASALVIGPAFSGGQSGSVPPPAASSDPSVDVDHTGHHP